MAWELKNFFIYDTATSSRGLVFWIGFNQRASEQKSGEIIVMVEDLEDSSKIHAGDLVLYWETWQLYT